MLKTAPALAACAVTFASAQPTSTAPIAPPPNGVKRVAPDHHILFGACLHPSPGETWPRALIEIEAGRITAARPLADGESPPTAETTGAVIHDLSGSHVYAAFIDPWVEVETPAPDENANGLHWSDLVTPQRRALDGGGLADSAAASHRGLGFAVAAIVPEGGVFAGRAAVVSLAKQSEDASRQTDSVIKADAFHAIDFERRGFRSYPSSIPGAVAMMRQTLSDAAWQRHFSDAAPNALTPLEDPAGVLAFDTDHELEAFLAHDVATESGREAFIVGSGTTFKWADAAADSGLRCVVPLAFPAKPDVSTVAKAEETDLTTMLEWEHGPANAAHLLAAGVDVSLTATKLPRGQSFKTNLAKALDNGLTEEDALSALTVAPARLLGIDDLLGTVEPGKIANLIVASDEVFDKDAKIHELWIDGREHIINERPLESRDDLGPFDGTWHLALSGEADYADIVIDGKKATVHASGLELDARQVKINGSQLRLAVGGADEIVETHQLILELATPGAAVGFVRTFDGELPRQATAVRYPTGEWKVNNQGFDSQSLTFDGRTITVDDGATTARFTSLSPTTDGADFALTLIDTDTGDEGATLAGSWDRAAGTMSGTVNDPARGQETGFSAAFDPVIGDEDDADNDEDEDDEPTKRPDHPGYPFGAYARASEPEQPETVLITGATVWTQTETGIVESASILISEGKIQAITDAASTPTVDADSAVIIDAQGKHVTPGIIDAHSHTGLFRFGVNEGGQAVTAEVDIADSLNPDDTNFYRQLASGVTTVLSLHGSANPIGGQSATHKLRWGSPDPHAMRMEGAFEGIKFALGENVKRSRGSTPQTRYPATRMGVETIIRDRFQAAKEYAAEWNGFYDRHAAVLQGVARPFTREFADKPIATFEAIADRVPDDAPPRRDLELETLAEILAGTRLVHCHSYRQDEIIMLARVAEDFGFQLGTYQHALEVYKVVDDVKPHVRGASMFADWWAYKMEVVDAIPYAGPIQIELGMNTSYNSDSNDLARRLNLEAAKALKYSLLDAEGERRVSPQEALALVTNNPAYQIGIEERTGAIAPGLDADLVIWSGDPLSTLSLVEQTWVDGRREFSLDEDDAFKARIAAERARLIAKLEGLEDKPEDNNQNQDGSPASADSMDEAREGDVVDPEQFNRSQP